MTRAYRSDDIVIQRRFGTDPETRAVKQIYAVTYPGHDDLGTESAVYEEAELTAVVLAERQHLSVWYEESPSSGRRTLIRSFRESH